ncbi:MAG: type II secretion system F family protein [Candidatus Hydrothermarchaeota archaeon]
MKRRKIAAFVAIGMLIFVALVSGGYRLYGDTKTFDTVFVLALVFSGFPLMLAKLLEDIRTRKIEKRFPDFLRDMVEASRAGVPLSMAFYTLAKSDYGALTDEVKKMATQISWGVPFEEVLEKFSERSNSRIVSRVCSLIIEANRAGGDISDILDSAARDAQMIMEIEEERKGAMRPYIVIIYLTFFVFIAIVVAIQKTMVPAMGGMGSFAFLRMPISPEGYRTLFYHLALIQAVFGGLVCGEVGEGSILAGLKHSVILTLIGYLVFQFLV